MMTQVFEYRGGCWAIRTDAFVYSESTKTFYARMDMQWLVYPDTIANTGFILVSEVTGVEWGTETGMWYGGDFRSQVDVARVPHYGFTIFVEPANGPYRVLIPVILPGKPS